MRWANRLTSLQRTHTVKDFPFPFPFPFYQGEWPSSWQHCNAIETKQLWSCQHTQFHILKNNLESHNAQTAYIEFSMQTQTTSFLPAFCCNWLVCQTQKRKKACKMHSITSHLIENTFKLFLTFEPHKVDVSRRLGWEGGEGRRCHRHGCCALVLKLLSSPPSFFLLPLLLLSHGPKTQLFNVFWGVGDLDQSLVDKLWVDL